MTNYRLFGIRHHGPGSARSLREAFAAWQPDCLLIEGPPEAQAALEWVGHDDLRPPVALLIYRSDQPRQAVYYPFAHFSPEWQALLWARGQGVPVRWMDLPQSVQLAEKAIKVNGEQDEPAERAAEQDENQAESPANDQTEEQTENQDADIVGAADQDTGPSDPFTLMGLAAGYSDGERYWEDLVEHRHSAGDVFEAIAEMMQTMREEAGQDVLGESLGESLRERRREAWMRQSLRQALKDGFERVAVVCGAWHVPAINPELPAKADKELLKGLAKVKTEVSWIPWTHSRLGWASGYGAGIESPGWYAHLWEHSQETSIRWMVKIARLLRAKGLDVSSAHLIEAVRLADTLATLREKPRPGLVELNEATVSVLTQGQQAPLQLIHQELIVGRELGSVPAELPAIPLQQDLDAELRRLRLKITAAEQQLSLDLRKPRDRDKSALLHRLLLLEIPWGSLQEDYGRKGSFGESWELRWEPEFSLRLIEAGVWGHRLAEAAASRTLHRAGESRQLEFLTGLLDQVLLADLPTVIPELMQILQNQAALTSDTLQLLQALPPLGRMLRYGSVRQLDTAALRHMLDGLLARVCLGLPLATHSLDEEAARALLEPLAQVHQMLRTLQEQDWLSVWLDTLEQLALNENLQGLLAGYFSRLLFDLGRWPLESLSRQLGRMVSPGTPADRAAGWIEGLLQGSGLLLVHHPALLRLLDQWICALGPEAFLETVPLLRRSFARFANPELRQIGELVRQSARADKAADKAAGGKPDTTLPEDFDPELALLTVPILKTLLNPVEVP